MGNSFTAVPSPWYHQITVAPVIIGFIAVVDEFILRRHIIVCIYIYLLMAIIFAFAATQITPFTALKSYSVLIPGLIIQLARLANVKDYKSQFGLHNKLYLWISKSSLKDNESLEFKNGNINADNDHDINDDKNINSKNVDSKIKSRKKRRNWIYYFIYVILCMNMLEAISFQTWVMFKEWGDTNANIGSFLNILSGICLLFAIPYPWYYKSKIISIKTIEKKQAFWYIDVESKYYDFCMYLPLEPYCFGAWWIILYNLWDLHFGIEYFRDGIEIMMLMHLLPCTITSFIGKRFHLWTLSRINNLLLYIVFVIPLRAFWLNTNSSNWPLSGESPFMIAFGAFNLVLSIIYCIVWHYLLHKNRVNSNWGVEKEQTLQIVANYSEQQIN